MLIIPKEINAIAVWAAKKWSQLISENSRRVSKNGSDGVIALGVVFVGTRGRNVEVTPL